MSLCCVHLIRLARVHFLFVFPAQTHPEWLLSGSDYAAIAGAHSLHRGLPPPLEKRVRHTSLCLLLAQWLHHSQMRRRGLRTRDGTRWFLDMCFSVKARRRGSL